MREHVLDPLRTTYSLPVCKQTRLPSLPLQSDRGPRVPCCLLKRLYSRAASSFLCKDTKAAVNLEESWLSSGFLCPSARARWVCWKHSCFLKQSCSGDGGLYPASGAAVQLLSAHWGPKWMELQWQQIPWILLLNLWQQQKSDCLHVSPSFPSFLSFLAPLCSHPIPLYAYLSFVLLYPLSSL